MRAADFKLQAAWIAIVIGMIGSLSVFTLRAPIYAYDNSLDFILVYSAARTWAFGGNPYDKNAVDQSWLEAGGPVEKRPLQRVESALIYPPTTLVMLAPFGVLPWVFAKPTWIIANVLFLAISVWCIARLAGFSIQQKRFWLLVIAALLFMPVHTTFRHGQTPLYVLMCVALASVAKLQPVGGAWNGFAVLIKPQIGLPSVALDVVRGRWKSFAMSLSVIMLIFGISIMLYMANGIDWFGSWRLNLAEFQNAGQGDPTPTNPMRHQLLNLHYPLHELIENRTFVQVLVLTVTGGLAAIFFRSWIFDFGVRIVRSAKRSAAAPNTLAIRYSTSEIHTRLLRSLSMVAVLSLLIVYHRFYDGVLLLFPLAWAMSAVIERRSKNFAAWCVLVLMIPFFLNSATALYWLEYNGKIPESFTEHDVWRTILMPHQSWALLMMGVCLIFGQDRRNGQADLSPPAGSTVHSISE